PGQAAGRLPQGRADGPRPVRGRAGGAAGEPDGGVVAGQGLRARPHRLVRRVGRLGGQGEVSARPRWLRATVVAVAVGVVALGAGIGACTQRGGRRARGGRHGGGTSSTVPPGPAGPTGPRSPPTTCASPSTRCGAAPGRAPGPATTGSWL